MKIMVFDVPAENGGALSILQKYYADALNCNDKNIMWYFVISLPELMETKNIKVLRYPWVKKSWLHRLYFDYIITPKLAKEYDIDKILSLQNLIIPKTNLPQTLYLHQPLPFVKKKFKIQENFKFWIYQNIIGRIIFKSISKADKIIVQTNWMKDACIEKVKDCGSKISVIQPDLYIDIKKYFNPINESFRTFFYPSSGLVYKNHKVIVESAVLLKNRGINDYKIIFTLEGNENKHIAALYKKVKTNNLPIEFIGSIDLNQVYELYTKTVLIFSSYIETFGLPMLEAKLHKSPIIASDSPFSHEILGGYNNVSFFEYADSERLSVLMESSIKNQAEYYN